MKIHATEHRIKSSYIRQNDKELQMEKYFSLPDTEELVELYANDVLRVCVFYLGSRSLAEDAFQDVFLKAIRKRDTFEGSCPPKYWLMATARTT